MPIIEWLLKTISFSMCQMIAIKTLVPFEQFDLGLILKVTAAIFNLNLAYVTCSKYLPQTGNQAVLSYVVCLCRVYHHAET